MSRQRISRALRKRVADAFQHRCGYCQTSEWIIGPLLEIDHIIPQSQGGTSVEENLTLACPLCNSYKSDQTEAADPVTGQKAPIFNPRQQNWIEHFEWAEEGSIIWGRTSIGRATVHALNMNDPDVVAARRLWVSVGWHPPIEE